MLHLPHALCLAFVALALPGCIGDGSPVKGAAELVGFATTPQPSKDFVRETRPADLGFVPVGTTVSRTAPRKQVADFKAMETALEAKRVSNEAAAAQAKRLGTTKPPAPPELR